MFLNHHWTNGRHYIHLSNECHPFRVAQRQSAHRAPPGLSRVDLFQTNDVLPNKTLPYLNRYASMSNICVMVVKNSRRTSQTIVPFRVDEPARHGDSKSCYASDLVLQQNTVNKRSRNVPMMRRT